MMRIAIIGDIHGNIYALESVIEDIKKRKVDFVISTGDLVGYLPFVNEVIDLMKQQKILSVKGNHDQVIGEGKKVELNTLADQSQKELWANASRLCTNAVITDENREYLNNLPTQIELMQDEKKIVVVHGSPKSINEYLYEDSEAVYTMHKEGVYDVVVSGHTHIPYHQIIEDKHYINPGSVGKPKHGNSLSSYVIITIKNQEIRTEQIKVAYSLEKIEEAIKGNRYISDELIQSLKNGK